MKKLSTRRLLAGMGQLIKPASIIILAMTSTLAIHEASAHGYVESPASRIIQCAHHDSKENPTKPACIAAKAVGMDVYTPQQIAVGGVRDNHMSFIQDGQLCSAANAAFRGLDLARNDWPATSVASGQTITFKWHNTAAHKTKYFRYYITRQGFNPGAAPLKWSDLEQIHQSAPAPQEVDSYHTMTMPSRTGRHIIYSIWQRDWDTDAAEGFYQCIDVEFGGSNSSISVSSSSSRPSSSSSSVSPDTCVGLPAWSAGSTYTPPTQVSRNGKRYQAAYWTQGDDPVTKSGYHGAPWIDLGVCNGNLSSSSSVTSSSRPSSSRSSSSSSVNNGSCTAPQFTSANGLYAVGAVVSNNGSEYRCTVYGWCGLANADFHYAPGTGQAWQLAWTHVRNCQ